jgi:putative two-component system protein, hydrogenase maturation factor HypX/HoxX
VTEAAVACVVEALDRLASGDKTPLMAANWGRGQTRLAVPTEQRRLDPETMTVSEALTFFQASDGDPGAGLVIAGEDYRVFDALLFDVPSSVPGRIAGRSGTGIVLGFRDGALRIGQVRRTGKGQLKLPATMVIPDAQTLDDLGGTDSVTYEETDGVGIIRFAFYNGAMSTADCEAMRKAVAAARQSRQKVLLLLGSADCWSNGIHLGCIENAESPADESWLNINAMNDLVREIILADDRIVVAGVTGNAGAGGVFLSLAADQVLMREGVILNPHYKDMGNLYGSEYWTYLLPMRVGEERARAVTQARLPMGIEEALRLGLATGRLPAGGAAADEALIAHAIALARSRQIDRLIADKAERRRRNEAMKPLEAYRNEELLRMKKNFYGFDPSYHVARYNFIRKVAKSRTPASLIAEGWQT